MLVSKYGDGQEREKEAFSEYADQMMAKDADGQEIVTKSLAKWNAGHVIDTRGYFEAVTIMYPPI